MVNGFLAYVSLYALERKRPDGYDTAGGNGQVTISNGPTVGPDPFK